MCTRPSYCEPRSPPWSPPTPPLKISASASILCSGASSAPSPPTSPVAANRPLANSDECAPGGGQPFWPPLPARQAWLSPGALGYFWTSLKPRTPSCAAGAGPAICLLNFFVALLVGFLRQKPAHVTPRSRTLAPCMTHCWAFFISPRELWGFFVLHS